MNKQDAYTKAKFIYDLFGNIGYLANYEQDGTLNFRYKNVKCTVKPKENDTYSMKVIQPHNRVQSTILCKIDNIKTNDLYNTFKKVMGELD